jgi:hypothetical protein
MSGHWPPEWEDSEDEFPQETDQLDPDTAARLSAVTAYLSSVPAPALPDAFAARISAALATEAAERAASAPADDATPPVAARTLEPASARTRRGRHRGGGGPRRASRALLTSGSVVAVCLVLVGFVVLLSRSASTSSSSSAVAGAAAGSSSSTASSSGAGSSSAAGTSAGPNVPGPSKPEFGGNVSNFTVTTSGTKYQAATLAAQVRARLATSGIPGGLTQAPSASAPAASASSTAPAPTASASSSSLAASSSSGAPVPAGLRGCVLRLTDGALPRLVDRATYQGEAAYIIAGSTRVWVVGLGCTAAKTELIASVPLAGLPGTSAP